MNVPIRIRALIAAVLMAAGISAVAALPASAAPNSVCALNQPASATRSFAHPGNNTSAWASPFGHVPDDIFRFTATGSTQIQPVFGAWKPPSGDVNDIAWPDQGYWPRTGVPKFALLMRITSGTAHWVTSANHAHDPAVVAGSRLEPFKWYYAGAVSDCVKLENPAASSFQFVVNDANVFDNSGGPTVTARQWW
ncbi:hypothetical protein AB0H12_41215 [Actinosynnema sp. NPDC023794]